MSETPNPNAAPPHAAAPNVAPPNVAPPGPRNSPLDPPAPRRLDPAALMIGVGGAVLLVALWWLLNTPRSTNEASVDPARVAQLEQRLGALEGVRGDLGTLAGRVNAFGAVEGRVQTLESRPAPAIPDIRPLEQQLNALNERSAANDRRVAALEGRPAVDPAAFAPRAALDMLGGRLDQLATRDQQQEAELTRRLQEAQRTEEQRDQAMQQRLQEAQRADEQREQAAQQRRQEMTRTEEQREQAAQQRLQEMIRTGEQREQAAQQRLQELTRAEEQREQGAQQAATQRLQALEATLNQKLAALEQAQQELRGQLDRSARLGALERMRDALAAGQPLGGALGVIGQPPPALARFAQTAPPTEADLKRSFEEAVRAVREAQAQGAAAETGRPAGVEGALSRIEGLVTARRGDQMLWGSSFEPELERARRALEAGDLEMSLQHVEKLPAPARERMQSWVDQARALLAARAALRQMTAG